jgi:hypothetical protein
MEDHYWSKKKCSNFKKPFIISVKIIKINYTPTTKCTFLTAKKLFTIVGDML